MSAETKVGVWTDLAEPCAPTPDAIRARLDESVEGMWDWTLDPLPALDDLTIAFKGRLQILGVIREGVGTGHSYETAADRAFLAAARLFGIGQEASQHA